MTREIWVDLPPNNVLERAKRFFMGADSGYAGWLDGEGEGFVRFRTFRGTLAVTSLRDEAAGGRTRVRISTLRAHPSIPLFLTQLRESASEAETRA